MAGGVFADGWMWLVVSEWFAKSLHTINPPLMSENIGGGWCILLQISLIHGDLLNPYNL